MSLVSIGDFARMSRLSAKALRLYDELGLLPPARVDPYSGYRWYAPEQLERAQLVASLRQLGLPLTQIDAILGLDMADAASQITRYWTQAEADHSARRELAVSLVDRLMGKRSSMYEVATRELPARAILTLLRHATEEEIITLGREFMSRFWHGEVPRIDGAMGAPFVIYYGQVSKDSDGPIEWCWPIPEDQAEEIAARYPDLTLRTDPAHEEAYVHLEDVPNGTQAMAVIQAMQAWGAAEHRAASGGIRQLYMRKAVSDGKGPSCDIAAPLVPSPVR